MGTDVGVGVTGVSVTVGVIVMVGVTVGVKVGVMVTVTVGVAVIVTVGVGKHSGSGFGVGVGPQRPPPVRQSGLCGNWPLLPGNAIINGSSKAKREAGVAFAETNPGILPTCEGSISEVSGLAIVVAERTITAI